MTRRLAFIIFAYGCLRNLGAGRWAALRTAVREAWVWQS